MQCSPQPVGGGIAELTEAWIITKGKNMNIVHLVQNTKSNNNSKGRHHSLQKLQTIYHLQDTY